MKKIHIFLVSLMGALTLIGFTACGEEPPAETPKYTVTYSANGGEGTAPEEASYEAGTVITVASNPFTYEGYEFSGWLYSETVYEAGAQYTIPEANTTFTAQWTEVVPEPEPEPEPEPSFTQSAYSYDRLGGGDLELPIDLDGAGFFYLQINGVLVNASNYSYDATKQAIVIAEDYVLSLDNGDIVVTAITDAETEDPVECTVTIEQSLPTTFDEETTKDFVFGRDAGVTFEVGYNGTTPKKLMQGENVVDESYYTYDEDSFTVKSEYLSLFSSIKEYSLVLSNNDVYDFSVTTNVIFATDYDVVTEHNETQSNTGQNPLYQYYDNVSIVDGPDGMSGKVLKITPNTENVTYDCNGYITLRASWWSSLWREVAFTKNKYYVVAFDYMTENTSVGDFCLSGPNTSWKEDLLLGEENDGIVHHFSTIVSMDDLNDGVYIWAKFIGGGGNVYVDNFKLAQLDAAPSLTAGAEYAFESGEDYTVSFDSADLAYVVKLNDEVITANYNASQGTLTIPATVMSQLDSGVYLLEVVMEAITLSVNVRISDNRVSEFTDESVVYRTSLGEAVKVYGNFDPTLRLVSLKQIDKAYDNGYAGGWDFSHGDTAKDYSSLVTFSPALNGEGYIEIPASVAELFWGETQLIAEFSNGGTDTVVLNSIETPFFTNYDDSTIRGWFAGTNGFKDSPLESGMWGGAQFGVEAQSAGDNALYVRSTQGATDTSIFTIRMHSHPWEWFNVLGTEGNSYRVTFEYQISSDLSDVYFMIMSSYTEDQDAYFFGDYDQWDRVDNDQYYKIRYNLIADGNVHTFDSGWFGFNPFLRMMKITMPAFTAADGRFVMIDDYRIVASSDVTYPLANLGNYLKGQSDDYSLNVNGETVSSVTVGGEDIGFTVNEGVLVFDKTDLEALDSGEYRLVVTTNVGIYRKNITISDNRVAILTETSKNVSYGTEAKLAGEFDESLEVVSLTRQGADDVWDPSNASPVAMNPEYVTVEADGLVLSTSLINQTYKTGKYVALLNNGRAVEFTLISNVIYYSNYDETNVYINIGGNSVICQDASMRELVNVDGNTMIKYTPENAIYGHSVGALSGGRDNFIFTFENRTYNNYNWYCWNFSDDDTVIFFFDYEVVANGKTPNYCFSYLDVNGEWHEQQLTGSGTFYIELPANNLKAFGINCRSESKNDVAGTYMLIDSIGFGILAE